VVPGSPPTNRSVPRVPPPITARRWTLRIPTRPLQTPERELHVIFLVLAGDRQRVGKLGVELVRIGDVDGLAKGEGIADGCMANVGLVVVVDELDDGEEILVIAGAGLHLGQVEGACAGGISWRRRRRRRSSACWRRHGNRLRVVGGACWAGRLKPAIWSAFKVCVEVLVVEDGASVDGHYGAVVAQRVGVIWLVCICREPRPSVFGFQGNNVPYVVHVP